ncbi:SagB family peptide dehydrogenase [Nonomuraea sp. NPDC050394]|uniref:SagB family peptide dehydrogenase n=1 Tax=Nonomuraea sp. NPDC050394 TaxID=3364363 RepID=UPI00378B27BA
MRAARLELWSFREDVHVETDQDTGRLTLHGRWDDVRLPPQCPAIREALRRMTLGPIRLENVLADPADRAALARLLECCAAMVVRSMGFGPDELVLSVVPLTPQARFLPEEPAPGRPVRLSRFATLTTDGSSYRLESPLSLHRVVLHGPRAVWLLSALGAPVPPERVAAPPLTDLLGYLLAAGMVVAAEDTGPPARFAEDEDPVLASWSPLDLMFHTRATLGRHDGDYGATYPGGDREPDEPVVVPATGPVVALPRPGWAQVLAHDPPLSAVLEARPGEPRFPAAPPTARDLGELLYRAARVRALSRPADRPRAELSERPYPSSGGCYPFELYVVAHRCTGLARGVYHYDPLGHRLELLTAAGPAELLDAAAIAANLPGPPPLLIVVTARFRRLSWKYGGLGYVLALKDLGLLVQSLSMVATAIGLRSRPADGGDIECAARVLGTDWRAESSLAALAVGMPDERRGDRCERRPRNGADWPARAAARLARAWRARSGLG